MQELEATHQHTEPRAGELQNKPKNKTPRQTLISGFWRAFPLKTANYTPGRKNTPKTPFFNVL